MKGTRISYFMRGLPLWYFLTLFFFYGYGKTDILTINKIAGLLALMLLGTSFIIGPMSYFLPNVFVPLRQYRKYLGVVGFFVGLSHAILSYVFYYNKSLYYMLIDPANQHRLAVYAGIFALGYFFLMTITSTNKAVHLLGAKKWKILQTGGYVALAVMMLHFILAETNDGVFVIKRPLGQIVFAFGFIVILVRVIVFLLKKFKPKPPE